MNIQLEEMLPIGGVPQFVSVRAAREGLPLLLYLHGGPGDAALPLVRKYNRSLENHFTVAVWEQRGAGKSYYPFRADEPLTIETFVTDAHAVAAWLLQRFGQQKLYLVGHSWGSVLGLRFCEQYPSLLHAYIGCGQVVNMQKSCRAAYEFALCHSTGRAKERLLQTDCTYTGSRWLSDLLFVTRLVVQHGGSLYGQRSYNRLVRDVLLSRAYSVRALIGRQKGAKQSLERLWPELMTVSFENRTAFDVPIVFVCGKEDFHVSSLLAKAYFDTITSDKRFHLFERSCHFPQWSQAEEFERVLLALLPVSTS